jgi:hypothetical protein
MGYLEVTGVHLVRLHIDGPADHPDPSRLTFTRTLPRGRNAT